jgi:hypothetical protein
MAFILVPKHGEEVVINAWNWRPTLEILRSGGLIDKENYERMGCQGCGGAVDAEVSLRIAELIERKLETMSIGERILADLTTTAAPKKQVIWVPETKAEEIDANDLYSASYDWLVKFRDFCKVCGGFKVV